LVDEIESREATSFVLGLVAIRVADLEVSRSFYARLGLEFEAHQHGSGPVHYVASGAGYILELYGGRVMHPGEGWLFRIGLKVVNLEAIVARVDPACVLVPPKSSPWGRRMVLADPDGNRVEIVAPD